MFTEQCYFSDCCALRFNCILSSLHLIFKQINTYIHTDLFHSLHLSINICIYLPMVSNAVKLDCYRSFWCQRYHIFYHSHPYTRRHVSCIPTDVTVFHRILYPPRHLKGYCVWKYFVGTLELLLVVKHSACVNSHGFSYLTGFPSSAVLHSASTAQQV